MEYKILIVDDKNDFINSLRDTLKNYNEKNHTVNIFSATNETGAKVLIQENPDLAVVFLDIMMEKIDSGLRLIKYIREEVKNTNIRIIILTGATREFTERDIISKYDINNFLKKNLINRELLFSTLTTNIDDYIKSINSKKELTEAQQKLNKIKEEKKEARNNIRNDLLYKMGYSNKIKELITFIEKIAETNTTIYLQGETGAGKQLIAEYVHHYSHRSSYPFVEINCSSIPTELFESEMFGYEPGAHSTARVVKKGKFELADKGTLFFDEINSLPIEQQAKILKVIEQNKFSRLGSEKTISIDIRYIFAGNSDLKQDILNKKFRQDLYERMVIKKTVPTLNERLEDIPHLVKTIIEKKQKEVNKIIDSNNIDEKVFEKLMNYKWTGNVRELQNVITLAMILSENGKIKANNIHFENTTNMILQSNPMLSDNFEKTIENIIVNLLEKNKDVWENKKSSEIKKSLLDIKKIPSIIAKIVHEHTYKNQRITAKLLSTSTDTALIRNL